nr:uncharacterized protein LOC127347387 [Lolium perenne]
MTTSTKDLASGDDTRMGRRRRCGGADESDRRSPNTGVEGLCTIPATATGGEQLLGTTRSSRPLTGPGNGPATGGPGPGPRIDPWATDPFSCANPSAAASSGTAATSGPGRTSAARPRPPPRRPWNPASPKRWKQGEAEVPGLEPLSPGASADRCRCWREPPSSSARWTNPLRVAAGDRLCEHPSSRSDPPAPSPPVAATSTSESSENQSSTSGALASDLPWGTTPPPRTVPLDAHRRPQPVSPPGSPPER